MFTLHIYSNFFIVFLAVFNILLNFYQVFNIIFDIFKFLVLELPFGSF